MDSLDRRRVLFAGLAAGAAQHPAIARALSIEARVRTGTVRDVEHVVVFMQENRAFDHYFGTMAGVRGFGDRFPIPLPDIAGREGATAWMQAAQAGGDRQRLVSPFPLNTTRSFEHMRVEGTPHLWPDAQGAWDEGRMDRWPVFKTDTSMGYYERRDIPFQFALAEAFTLCDAYHCSLQMGTNPNRLFLWTGTNDPSGRDGGPVLANTNDRLVKDGGGARSYTWKTYVERLQDAGVTWRIYQDMADNFTDNPLVGFQAFRDAHAGLHGSDPRLLEAGLSTYRLDRLREDVLAGRLPQVSYIVAPAAASEHPLPSSPAQGADFTAQVLDALTADPEVWSKTVLFLMFDENDGFFDHVPPPSPPSRDAAGREIGGSTIETAGEYHLVASPSDLKADRPELRGRPYGLGPRVPMYVVSPWSRGGWVNSQVFDHTSVIRFLEARFGVPEPNISPWRRAVCGDLTSAFDFKTPNTAAFPPLPATGELAARAKALPRRTTPPTPPTPGTPVQEHGVRPSRALPYAPEVVLTSTPTQVMLRMTNLGATAVVLHVYDRTRLHDVPRRYTIGAGGALQDTWELPGEAGAYDLWVLGPNGFHRHFMGYGAEPLSLVADTDPATAQIRLTVRNAGSGSARVEVTAATYGPALPPWRPTVTSGRSAMRAWALGRTGGWYDFQVATPAQPGWRRRLAGRIETGRDAISDPALGGPARLRRDLDR
ncbi:MAG: phospholipase C, phosphocholine-specific [Phenylobacterium zucineum]|nr:MAG: phospholipase C, phosphocholine-specific [Phenylobacterium zucineum]